MSDDEAAEAAHTPSDIRLAAMNLLARREHSIWELRRKLKRRFSDESMLDEQLLRLAEQNLQSDTRFAESYARQRISRGYGPLRLQEELRERGVCKADIALALEGLEIDWCAHANEVMQIKFGSQPARELKEQARRVRFMQHRGFSSDHYQRLLRD